MIKLTLDMADLFVVKYPNTIGSLLTLKRKERMKEIEEKIKTQIMKHTLALQIDFMSSLEDIWTNILSGYQSY